jgi:hypothetical protein
MIPYNYIQIVADDDWGLVGIVPHGKAGEKIKKMSLAPLHNSSKNRYEVSKSNENTIHNHDKHISLNDQTKMLSEANAPVISPISFHSIDTLNDGEFLNETIESTIIQHITDPISVKRQKATNVLPEMNTRSQYEQRNHVTRIITDSPRIFPVDRTLSSLTTGYTSHNNNSTYTDKSRTSLSEFISTSSSGQLKNVLSGIFDDAENTQDFTFDVDPNSNVERYLHYYPQIQTQINLNGGGYVKSLDSGEMFNNISGRNVVLNKNLLVGFRR